ncbi:MAG TPA: thiamine pyrophosphate-binding protein, partial [Hyphomicrobium sp.]|nr:thiamine pyrophosphate-binding protein [Hyphomicrobium sp.]
AGHMADGFARASGRHGVCIAQNGPGITNFVTAVAAAYWAHSPVVVITPETGTNTQGLGGFQETGNRRCFLCGGFKGFDEIDNRIAPFVPEAAVAFCLERGAKQPVLVSGGRRKLNYMGIVLVSKSKVSDKAIHASDLCPEHAD